MITRLVLFLLGCAAGGCTPRAGEFSGTWRLTHSISRGKETSVPTGSVPTRVFDGQYAEGRRPSSIPGKPFEVSGRARYWIDRSKTPKTIDLEYVEGPAMGMVYHGIYEISGDVMKICVALNGGRTPAAFESPVGSETNLDFYERVK
jgi:uncharacterized protein (TIGR03067 family)